MPHCVEVARAVDRRVADDLARMIAWLKRSGLQARHLGVKEAQGDRVIYRAEFGTENEARRFYDAFDETGAETRFTAPGFV